MSPGLVNLILGMFPTFIFLVFILCKSESPIKITLIRLEFALGSVGCSGVVGLLFLFLQDVTALIWIYFVGVSIALIGFASSIDLVITLSVIMEHSW